MRWTGLMLSAAAALAASAGTARAQPVRGFYMSGGVGAAFPHGPVVTSPSQPGLAPAPTPADPAAPGAAGQGSFGYGVGNGLRFETEGFGSASRLRLPKGP